MAAILAFPEITDACPMCQPGFTKDQVSAYKGITLLLALLPIVGGTALFLWIFKKYKGAGS